MITKMKWKLLTSTSKDQLRILLKGQLRILLKDQLRLLLKGQLRLFFMGWLRLASRLFLMGQLTSRTNKFNSTSRDNSNNFFESNHNWLQRQTLELTLTHKDQLRFTRTNSLKIPNAWRRICSDWWTQFCHTWHASGRSSKLNINLLSLSLHFTSLHFN